MPEPFPEKTEIVKEAGSGGEDKREKEWRNKQIGSWKKKW